MATPSLVGPRQRLNALMTDTVTITHTTATNTDDAIDPSSGKPIAGGGETPSTVYTGPALISPAAANGASPEVHPGGAPVDLDAYDVFIPWDSPLPVPGDHTTITAAGDPAMVGLVLVILSVETGTLNLARAIHTQVLTPARPVHGR